MGKVNNIFYRHPAGSPRYLHSALPIYYTTEITVIHKLEGTDHTVKIFTVTFPRFWKCFISALNSSQQQEMFKILD